MNLNPKYVQYGRISARVCGVIVFCIGWIVMLGWILDLESLKSLITGLATMKANTAIAFIFAGAALWLSALEDPKPVQVFLMRLCAGVVALLGSLTLGEYIFGTNLGIDQFLFVDLNTPLASFPGRMSIVTALNFFLIGISLLFMHDHRKRIVWITQTLILLAYAITAVALVGYVYDVQALYRIGPFLSMALHIAIAFFLLVNGILFAQPERGIMGQLLSDSIGGRILRRFLPVVVGVPIGLSLLFLFGEKYDLYNVNFGLAVMVILNASFMSLALWFGSRWLNQLDDERKRAGQKIEWQNERLKILREIDMAILAADSLESIVRAALDHINELINCKRASMVSMDWRTNEARVFNVRAVKETSISTGTRVPLAHFQEILPILSKNQPILINDLHSLVDPPPSIQNIIREGFRSLCFLPIVAQGRLIGALSVSSESPGFFDQEKIDLGLEIANQVALALTQNNLLANVREQQARTAGIINSAMDAIISIDENQQIILFNPAAEVIFQCEQAEALGQPLERFIPERFRAAHREHIRNFEQTGVTNRAMNTTSVLIGLRSNGEEFPIEASISQIEIDEEKLYTVILRDIAERKHAEAMQAQLAAIVDSSDDAIIGKTLDGVITSWNPGAEQLYGYSAGEAIGQYIAFLIPPDRSDELPEILAQLKRGENVKHFETVRLRKDGTRLIVSLTISLVKDDLSRINGASTIARDITEHRQAEDELKRSNAELEQFAYVASHDLQEPLRAVAGMVQLLQRRYHGKLDERADEYIGHAVEASARMQTLINDLLDYSRAGRLGKPFAATRMEKTLDTALANLQIAIQESGAQITRDPLPTIMADVVQLTQVLQNLIGNAIKFRGAGSPKIHIGAEKLENGWRFSVRDNGIGIEPQYFERIFLVFQRLHTRREYYGTGIGLSLCKKIVERHHGQIWVESELEKGSTFYFTIPER